MTVSEARTLIASYIELVGTDNGTRTPGQPKTEVGAIVPPDGRVWPSHLFPLVCMILC